MSRISRLKEQEKTIKKEKKEQSKEKRKSLFKKLFMICLILGILALIYAAFIEPNILLVNEHKIETDKITENYHGLKIVHFTDLHYGTTINKKNIHKIINAINELKPDIVVFTGDLMEDRKTLPDEDIEILIKSLKNINSTLGKYAVLGNHDMNNPHYDHYANIFYDSDFKYLNNDYDLIYKNDNHPILIYGVDELLFGEPSMEPLNELKLENNIYKIVLAHEPDYIDEIDSSLGIDLVLSGHSHNGQFKIPYIRPIFLPEGSRKYYAPYYKVNDIDLYVSNGVGTSALPIRFASIPSINLYRITKSN